MGAYEHNDMDPHIEPILNKSKEFFFQLELN